MYERYIDWSVASRTPPTGALARNPGMCLDWELNLWPFSVQAGTQSTEPHQPGQNNAFLKTLKLNTEVDNGCQLGD